MSDTEDVGLEPHGVRDCVVWLVAHAKELDKRLDERDRAQFSLCTAHSERIEKIEERTVSLEKKTIWAAGAFAAVAIGFEICKDSIKGRLGIK